MEFVTYELALFAAVGFLIGGIDDLAVDVLWFLKRVWRPKQPGAGSQKLPASTGPLAANPMALFIPAWDESAVIGRMLEHTGLLLAEQPVTIFVGCYPNDPATQKAVDAAADRYSSIRRIICPRGIR